MGDTGSLGLGGAIGALAVMTQTEVLLIIIGGIFVIEALSVAIQVFTFKTFRRRVFLMAPLHHHFEMMAWSETKIMLRFWIIAAVCSGIGFTLYQQSHRPLERCGYPAPGQRSTADPERRSMSGIRPVIEGAPAAAAGPFLVVGLARSGVAAATLLAGRVDERCSGVDSGHPEGSAGARCEPASKSTWIRDGLAQLEGTRTSSRARACRARRRSIAAALERGIDGHRRARARPGWRSPNRFLAVTGTNGKTTTVELLGHIFRTAGEPVEVAGNVGDAASALAGEIEPRRDRRLRGLQLPARGHEPASRPSARSSSTSRPTTSTATATSSAYRDAKLRIFANQGNDDVAVYNADDPELAGVDLGGCARRIAFCRGADARLRGRAAEGHDLLATASRCSRSPSSASSATTTSPTRWPPPPRRSPSGIDRDAVAQGLRSFGGVPHRLEPVAEIDGVRFVNDSKATNVASADRRHRAFDGGVHVILGGSEKGEPFAPLLEPLARALPSPST